MNEKDYDFIMRTLRELTLYIYECNQKESSLQNEKALNKRLFNFPKLPSDERERSARENIFSAMPGTAPSRRNVDSKLNRYDKNLINSNNLKGDELMKLKHGQGSIQIKLRYNKNGTIYKIYHGRYYDEFGKVKSVYGKTQKECIRKLKELNPMKKDKPIKKIYPTVAEWMLSWYNDYKKDTLRPSTQRGYETSMHTYIFPVLGKIKLPQLTTEHLQHFFKKFDSGNTRHKIFLLMSACLKKAVILKKIQSNPCDAVELPKYKKKKRRPFEFEEQNKILSEDGKIAQVFFFLCVTGLRVGEFLALTKNDFYPEEHVFKIDKAIAYGVKGDPKSEASNRTVYYLDELFDYFDVDLLGTFTYYGLRQGFDKILEQNDVHDVSLHCTRHTYATLCHKFGMNDKTLQSQLGHSTLAMTQDVYTHLLKKGTSKVGAYLEKLCTHIRTHT